MATVAILCLLLLERFLASDMDVFTEPVLVGLRALEKTALRYTQNIIPPDLITRHKKLSKFYLFTPEAASDGVRLEPGDRSGFRLFNPHRETKVIIHGFMDKVMIAEWMHHMKDEFLLLDDFNVIVVDWSIGNTIPYTQAAANTERAGKEIAELMLFLIEKYGAKPSTFHLIGHSLGSHVAGHIGERIKGIKRITGLDPATHLFSSASSRTKLDRSDAEFVDVIHTDAGGIGIPETEGHVDFYPNGGEIQPGCTASNSLNSLLERGVVEEICCCQCIGQFLTFSFRNDAYYTKIRECIHPRHFPTGVRNIICSHMRAPLLFTDTINGRYCKMVGQKCKSQKLFKAGECDSCGQSGLDCATMGYHIDTKRNYGNASKFFLLTAGEAPFCGYEYKLTFERVKEGDKTWRDVIPNVFRRRRREWSSSDTLHVSIYGSSGSAEFEIQGNDKQPFQSVHVVFSPVDMGVIHGAIAHWDSKVLTRRRGVVSAISSAFSGENSNPFIHRIKVKPMKLTIQGRNVPTEFELCVNPKLTSENKKGVPFRNEYC